MSVGTACVVVAVAVSACGPARRPVVPLPPPLRPPTVIVFHANAPNDLRLCIPAPRYTDLRAVTCETLGDLRRRLQARRLAVR